MQKCKSQTSFSRLMMYVVVPLLIAVGWGWEWFTREVMMNRQQVLKLIDWLVVYIALPLILLFIWMYSSLVEANDAPVNAGQITQVAETVASAAANQPGVNTRVQAKIDARVAMPACAQPLQGQVHSDNNTAMSIAVSCAAPQPWTLYVPVRLEREAEVLVLTSSLPAGTKLQASHLSRQTRNIGQLAYGYLQNPAEVVGNNLRRPLQAGWVLSGNDIESPRLVKRGETVTLVARLGSIEVRAQGQALSDAGQDESIRVRNLSSKRIIDGRVASDGTVRVGY